MIPPINDAPGSSPSSANALEYSATSTSEVLGRVAKHSLVYGLSNLLMRMGNFFLIPIYWKHIDPAGYGIVGLTEVLLWVVVPVMTLGLEGAIMRFFHEWPQGERKERIAAHWTLQVLVAALWLLLLEGIGGPLWSRVAPGVPFHPYARIVLATAFFQSLLQIPLALWRVQERSGIFTAVNLSIFLANAALGIYWVAVREEGVAGLLKASAVANAGGAILSCVFVGARSGIRLSWTLVRPSLALTAPIVPTSLLQAVPRFIDRFALERILSLQFLGIYSLGNTFGNIVLTANTSLKAAWIPTAIRVGTEHRDALTMLAKMGRLYVAAMAGISLAVALLTREFVLWANREKYAGVYDYVPAFVLIQFILAFDVLAVTGFMIRKQMGHDLWIFLGQAVAATVLVLAGVRYYGPSGAIVAVMIVRGVTGIARLVVSLRVCPVPYEFGRWAVMMGSAIGTFFAGKLAESQSLGAAIAVKCGLLLAWGVLIGATVLNAPEAWRLLQEARRKKAGTVA